MNKQDEKKSKPLVTGIIIFLNEERFLEEAIKSVLVQTYNNWELLLVDDGSTDHSTEISLRYSAQYPEKIRYLRHEGHQNLGMSSSRNLGVRNAKGMFIAYLDGDDIWLPNMLERQIAILESQPEAAMVCAPLQCWYSWTGNSEDIHRDHLYGHESGAVHPYGNALVRPPNLLNLFLRNEGFIPSSVMVRRDVIENVGGYEDDFRDAYSDAVVFVKICLTSTVFVSNECWYKYRKHFDSYTYKASDAGILPELQRFYLNWIKKYILEQGVKDPSIWKALNYAIWAHNHPWLYYLKGKILGLGQRVLPVPVHRWLRSDR